MAQKLIKTKLTPKFYKHIEKTFTEYSIDTIGMNGFDTKPVLFKLKDGKKLMGYMLLQLYCGQMYLKNLLVEKEYRGHGIGTRLMQHCFKYAKELNCDFVFLETLNFQAPLFYHKFGFEIEFKREGYMNGISLYYLRKNL